MIDTPGRTYTIPEGTVGIEGTPAEFVAAEKLMGVMPKTFVLSNGVTEIRVYKTPVIKNLDGRQLWKKFHLRLVKPGTTLPIEKIVG